MTDHEAELVRDGDFIYAIHKDDGKVIRFCSPKPKNQTELSL